VTQARPSEAPSVGLELRPMISADWSDVAAIFSQGISTNDATLESAVPSWAQWDLGHRPYCRFVATLGERVVGWTALSSYSERAVYGGVAWESVYVAEQARRAGVGRALLEALVAASEAAGVWTLMAGVQIENSASLALHERVGFRRIGVQERIGRDPTGRWRDVVLLERRSGIVGT
jgi:L-amino acid N-acyltransferase YncA